MTHRVLRPAVHKTSMAVTCPRCRNIFGIYGTSLPHIYDTFCCNLRYIWVNRLYRRDRWRSCVRRVSKMFWATNIAGNRIYVKRGF